MLDKNNFCKMKFSIKYFLKTTKNHNVLKKKINNQVL